MSLTFTVFSSSIIQIQISLNQFVVTHRKYQTFLKRKLNSVRLFQFKMKIITANRENRIVRCWMSEVHETTEHWSFELAENRSVSNNRVLTVWVREPRKQFGVFQSLAVALSTDTSTQHRLNYRYHTATNWLAGLKSVLDHFTDHFQWKHMGIFSFLLSILSFCVFFVTIHWIGFVRIFVRNVILLL